VRTNEKARPAVQVAKLQAGSLLTTTVAWWVEEGDEIFRLHPAPRSRAGTLSRIAPQI
jgi:hypothetical protein